MAPRLGIRSINPFLLELEQSQADVAAMRVEAVAQILFDQTLARMAAAQDDILFEAGGDDIGDRRSAHPPRRFVRPSLRRWRRAASLVFAVCWR